MSSLQVECWNCGLKLRVKLDKLAIARCGNCQQMVVREEPVKKEAEPVYQLPSEVRSETGTQEESQVTQKKGFHKIATATVSPDIGIPKAISTPHAFTSKELAWGVGMAINLSLLHKIIFAALDTYWLVRPSEERREAFFL